MVKITFSKHNYGSLILLCSKFVIKNYHFYQAKHLVKPPNVNEPTSGKNVFETDTQMRELMCQSF